MDAALKIKIAPEYLAVRYDCRLESVREQSACAVVDSSRLSRLIQDDMECEVLPAGKTAWIGTVKGLEKNDGKISFHIIKTKKGV